MPFFAASEARIDEIPCKLPASREFGIFRDEFAADSPLQRRVCEPPVPLQDDAVRAIFASPAQLFEKNISYGFRRNLLVHAALSYQGSWCSRRPRFHAASPP